MPHPVAEQDLQRPERARRSCDPPAGQMHAPVEQARKPQAVRHHQQAAAGCARRDPSSASPPRPRSSRRDCRSARRRAAAPAGSPAHGRWRRAAAARRTVARDSDRAASASAEPLGEFVLPRRIEAAGDARLERQIVSHLQARDQIELLEHQTEPVAPHPRALAFGQLRRSPRHRARSRRCPASSRPAIRCSSVLLPLPDSPVSADALAARHLQIDLAQHRQHSGGNPVALAQPRHGQHGEGSRTARSKVEWRSRDALSPGCAHCRHSFIKLQDFACFPS